MPKLVIAGRVSLRQILTSPGFVSVAGVLVVAIVTAATYISVFDPPKKTLGYCASMPDAVGLYVGSHVTVRGIPVGSVTAIRRDGVGVRVDFDVDAQWPLRGAVTATTVSNTIVADRDLAVLSDNNSPAYWDRKSCITKTFTPKSITETLGSFAKLADTLGGSGDPTKQDRIRGAVAALAQATSGTGPRINELITQLAAALRSPDAAIGHLGDLVDATNGLAQSTADHWAEIKTVLLQFAPTLDLINGVFGDITGVVNSLVIIYPWINGEILMPYGGAILGGLDAAVPYIHLLAADVGALEQIVKMVPPIVTAMRHSIDPVTGQPRITYAPPKTASPQQQTEMTAVVLRLLGAS